jgi:hypothetical protein
VCVNWCTPPRIVNAFQIHRGVVRIRLDRERTDFCDALAARRPPAGFGDGKQPDLSK